MTDPTGLDHLYRIEKFLESMTDLDSLLAAVMAECAATLVVESVSLALYDPETDELQFHVARGGSDERDFEQQARTTLRIIPEGRSVFRMWRTDYSSSSSAFLYPLKIFKRT